MLYNLRADLQPISSKNVQPATVGEFIAPNIALLLFAKPFASFYDS